MWVLFNVLKCDCKAVVNHASTSNKSEVLKTSAGIGTRPDHFLFQFNDKERKKSGNVRLIVKIGLSQISHNDI